MADYDDEPANTGPRRVTDRYGNALLSAAGTASGVAVAAVDARIIEFDQFGVFNGSFSRSPIGGTNTDIDPVNNPLPDWYGPVSVSGGAITAQWLATSGVRFFFAAGAANDEVYFEQIVLLEGSTSRWGGNALRSYVTAGASNTDTFQHRVSIQYLDVNYATTGSAFTNSVSIAAGASSANVGGLTAQPPADAWYLRIRVGVVRTTGAASATGYVDLFEARRDWAHVYELIADQADAATYKPAAISQTSGVVAIQPNLSATAYWQMGSGGLVVPEQAAPSTPASGFHAVYAGTDSLLYGKNDGGTVYQLAPATSSLLFATTDITSSGALNTTKDYAASPASVTSYVVPYAGSVIGIGVRLAAADARTGGAITFQVWNATTSALIGPTAVINASNTLQDTGTSAVGAATFAAGDRIGVRSTVTTATYAPITGDVTIFVLVAFTLT